MLERNQQGSLACVLKKIIYPTKGYAEFEFENNTYGKYSNGTEVLYQENIPHDAEVNATSNSSGCHPLPATPNCEDVALFTVDHEQDALITKYEHTSCLGCDPVEITLYNLLDQNTNILPFVVSVGTTIHLLPGDYRLVATSFTGCNPGGGCSSVKGNIKIQYYSLGSIIKTRIAPGLRIKRIKRSDGLNQTSDITTNYYYNLNDETDRSSGLFVNVYNFANLGVLATQLHPGSPCWCDQLYISAFARNLGLANGSYVNYAEITVTHESAIQDNGKEINLYDPLPYADLGSQTYPFSPFIYKEYQNLRLQQKIFKDADGNLVRSIVNDYSPESSLYTYSYGLKSAFWVRDPSHNTNEYNDYSYKSYYYDIKFSHITSTVTTTYNQDHNPSHYVEEQSNYFYDNPNHVNPTRIVTTTSDGKTETQYFKYAQDYLKPANPTEASVIALNNMATTSHMHNVVIESYKTKLIESEDYIVDGSFTKYNLFGDLILPIEEYKFNVSSPLLLSSFNETTIPSTSSGFALDLHYQPKYLYKYTTSGNLMQYNKIGEKPISTQWDNDGFNIEAQFNGASYIADEIGDECSYNGFESSDLFSNDQWNPWASIFQSSGAHTGNGYVEVPEHSYGPTKDFNPTDQNQKFIFSGWIKTPIGFTGNSDTYICITSEQIGQTDPYPPTNVYAGSQPITLINPTGGEWKYFRVVIDFASIHAYLIQHSSDEILYLRAFVRNESGYSIFVDDLRFAPYPSIAQSITYNSTFTKEPSSMSDQKSLPTYYDYDKFGRLSLVKDDRNHILKSIQYNYRDN